MIKHTKKITVLVHDFHIYNTFKIFITKKSEVNQFFSVKNYENGKFFKKKS